MAYPLPYGPSPYPRPMMVPTVMDEGSDESEGPEDDPPSSKAPWQKLRVCCVLCVTVLFIGSLSTGLVIGYSSLSRSEDSGPDSEGPGAHPTPGAPKANATTKAAPQDDKCHATCPPCSDYTSFNYSSGNSTGNDNTTHERHDNMNPVTNKNQTDGGDASDKNQTDGGGGGSGGGSNETQYADAPVLHLVANDSNSSQVTEQAERSEV